VAVLGAAAAAGAKQHRVLELSARASTVAAARAGAAPAPPVAWDTLALGQTVLGAIQEAADDHLYVCLSPAVRGRVHVLHAAGEVSELRAFRRRFVLGGLVTATVVALDAAKQRLDLSLLGPEVAAPVKGVPLEVLEEG